MKTTKCADSSCQLSESFIEELQSQGFMANNLAVSNKSNRAINKQFSVDDLSTELLYLQDNDGDTQLHIAIINDQIDIALALINVAPSSSHLDIQNNESFTALHCAASYGQSMLVRALVLAGASTELRTSQGDTALHFAAKKGHIDCVKALSQQLSLKELETMSKCNIPRLSPQLPAFHVKNYLGMQPIHIAAINGDVKMVHELLLAGADVNAQEGLSGKTALHLAIEKKHAEVVYYLAQIPTALLATTYGGDAAYQIAFECAPQYVETLLRFGAAPVIRTHDDDSMSEDESSSSDEDYEGPSYAKFTDSYSNAVNTNTFVTV